MELKPERETYQVLPDQAQPCVWMVAGLLSYRLCDRDFDCEHCPLDAAIHGSRGVIAPERVATPEAPVEQIRDGLQYHPIYGWVAGAPGNRVRWGIDGVTALLLDRVTAVVLPAAGTVLTQGKAACWAMDDGELIPLCAPVSGVVARTNPAVRQDPTLVSHAPYDAGWLVEVEAGSGTPPAWMTGLCDAERRRATAARQLERFHHAAAVYLHAPPGVGETAQDGGEPLGDFRRMLGKSRYHRLVFSLLR
jgi:glycine cleavage system H lipoate-binding protein